MNDCSVSLLVALLLLVDGRREELTPSGLQPEWCSAPPAGNGQCAPCGAWETLPSRQANPIIHRSDQSLALSRILLTNSIRFDASGPSNVWLIAEPLYCCVYKSSSTTFAVCSTPECPSIPGYTLASSTPVQNCGSCKAPTDLASIRIIGEDDD